MINDYEVQKQKKKKQYVLQMLSALTIGSTVLVLDENVDRFHLQNGTVENMTSGEVLAIVVLYKCSDNIDRRLFMALSDNLEYGRDIMLLQDKPVLCIPRKHNVD